MQGQRPGQAAQAHRPSQSQARTSCQGSTIEEAIGLNDNSCKGFSLCSCEGTLHTECSNVDIEEDEDLSRSSRVSCSGPQRPRATPRPWTHWPLALPSVTCPASCPSLGSCYSPLHGKVRLIQSHKTVVGFPRLPPDSSFRTLGPRRQSWFSSPAGCPRTGPFSAQP